MLIITRRPGEKVMLGDDVVVEVIEVSGSSVRIGIDAPKSVPVYREEIWRAVRDENAAAAKTGSGALARTGAADRPLAAASGLLLLAGGAAISLAVPRRRVRSAA